MCGILGHLSSKAINKFEFEKDILKLQHRGPDDYGTFFDHGIALGHTRLSIIDLSNEGHQPMFSNCGNYIIIYNGEIYNFGEIKKDLLIKGHVFNSNTDTEVILNGFLEYQEKIVFKLEGMFAFSIYNKITKQLFLARDRSGIKPLYYYKDSENFAYSSEIKTLKKYSSKVNLNSKILFLLLGYIPEPTTIYENIVMFPPGHYGYFKHNRLTIFEFDKYYFEQKILSPYDEIVSNVKELFQKAIKKHLVSDANIGTFLSGGLDSSAITAVVAKYKTNPSTLSLIFDEKDFSEEYYQDVISDRYSTRHTKYLVNEGLFIDNLEKFFTLMEQPTIDGLNTYFISKAANDCGLATVLSGLGADEIFHGYPSFRDAKTLKFLSKIPYSLIKIFEYSSKYKKIELVNAENELAYYLPRRAIFSPKEIANILNIDKLEIYNLIVELYKSYNSSMINEIEDKISHFELNMYMKNQLLRDSDLFGMANSIEIRVPFLDKELVDYILKIEPKEKVGKFNKQILVDCLKNILPLEIINRKKKGFVLPYETWLRKNIGLFKINENIKNDFLTKNVSWSKFWSLIVLEQFK